MVDGDLAEWKDVPALRLPSTDGTSSRLKLAWNKDGLHGAVVMEQGDIHVNRSAPAQADSVEICVESDALRRLTAGRESVPFRLYLSPDSPESDGKAVLRKVSGKLSSSAVQSSWRKTATGYTLEFRITTKGLTPDPEAVRLKPGEVAAKTPPQTLEVGRKMSFDLVLRHDGRTVEQFADTRPFRTTTSSPVYWGQVRLAEK
jgi:hypothetical protein